MARIPDGRDRAAKERGGHRAPGRLGRIGLKRAGKDLLGRCPFHDDREASLVVTPAKNLWHCLGAVPGGGPIEWVMRTRASRSATQWSCCEGFLGAAARR